MIPTILLQEMGSQAISQGGASGKGGDGGTDGFADILGNMTGGCKDGATSDVSDGASLSGHSGLTRLKQELMASGHCLEDYTANPEAMSEFGAMLVKMGFDAGEVEEMMSGFTARAASAKVTLADLFKGASQLSAPGAGEGAALDVSALPDLENILGGLGMDPETRNRLLSEALVDGDAVDLNTLAAGIRRALGGMGAGSGACDAEGALQSMKRLGLLEDGNASVQATLDELISEVSRFNDLQKVLEESDGADGLPGSLLVAYLQQLAAPLGNDGKDLKRLIASAGTEGGGFDGSTLLSKLVQMKQDLAIQPASGSAEGQPGQMTLSKFAAILEEKVAGASVAADSPKTTSTGRSLAENLGGFLNNITQASETASDDILYPMDLEGESPFEGKWHPGAKRLSGTGGARNAANSASEAIGKNGALKEDPDTLRQAAAIGEADRELARNSSEKASTERFSDFMNASGREKTTGTANDTGIGTEALVRQMRSGNGAASLTGSADDRNLPSYLLNQVSRQIIRMRGAGENEITLQLKPSHLGRMKLNIEHTSGGIRVGIVVESQAARDMLLAHTNELKASLADQGLRLDRIDVEAQADFGHSMAQAEQGADRFGGRRGRGTSGRWAAGDALSAADGVTVTAQPGLETGRLDLVA